MDLSDHFRAIWSRRWPVLVASVAVAALVFGWSATRRPVYSAEVLISVTSGRSLSGESVTEQDAVFLTRNYAELARTVPVLTDAVMRSGLPLTGADAGRRLSARAATDVGFLTLQATGPTPDAATALARGASEALLGAVAEQQAAALRDALEPAETEIRKLEEVLSGLPGDAVSRRALEGRYEAVVQAATERRLAPTDQLVLVAPARAEPAPVSPAPRTDAALALLIALVVNAEIAVLIEARRDRFSTVEQDESIGEVTGLPVLARIPSGGGEPVIEAVRALRTSLMFMETGERMRSVAVVSVGPNAGKTFIALHLATSVASLEIPVVLVDGDLRRPSVHRELGLSLSPGLGDLLGGAAFHAALRRTPGNDHLHIMTAGSEVSDPAGVLGSRSFTDVLSQLDVAGMVVVDTPACALFADALAIGSHCDATIVVVDPATTKRRSVGRLLRQLRQVGANPIGVVVNRIEQSDRASYSYYRHRPQGAGTR